jgi:nitrogen fixation protein NifU and related proteins
MDLKDLYRDVILDHNKRPRNFGVLAPPAIGAKGHNPLCGDQLTVYVDLVDGVIRDVKFEGTGCAISVASASLMTEAVKGLDTAAFARLHARVHEVLTQHDAEVPADLGKLAALGGVREYPARVKCASLSWRTLESALAGAHNAVTTE